MTRRDLKKIIYIELIILIICSTVYILQYFYDIHKTQQQSDLLENITVAQEEIAEKGEESEDVAETVKTERMLKVEELQKENPDIVAWIEIENTNIDYPVLQFSDNDYYMNHNYKGEYSKSGSIFLDKDYVWEPPSSNLLIYGHNMLNNTMFQDLLKYRSKDFYTEHPVIRFTTANEDSNYEIIAAFESRLYYKYEKDVFRYYFFVNAENEEEYDEFVKKAKNASLYDTGKTAKYGDQLMTLSTCSYHVKDGRFAVVARKIPEVD